MWNCNLKVGGSSPKRDEIKHGGVRMAETLTLLVSLQILRVLRRNID